jgi:hypothetical protein
MSEVTADKRLRRYEVIRRDSCDELAVAVGAYLNAGWELAGGAHVATDTSGTIRDGDGEISTNWIWTQSIWRYEA